MSHLLADVSKGRDNNLNLLRMVAACGVLVSHAWPISLGPEATQPMSQLTGFSLGTICVLIFFIVSGFLIPASFARSTSRLRFALARTLRLLPGLFVSLVLVAFLIGPVVTTLPLGSYLTNLETWTFLVRNSAMAFPQFTLPGVFESNPYTDIEGSIWTLIHEVLCYIGVFVAGIFGLLGRRGLASIALIIALMLWAVFEVFEPGLHPKILAFVSLAMPFGLGTAAWLWRDRISLSLPVALVLWGLWTVAFQTLGVSGLASFLFAVALAYSVFWIGYVPGGICRAYNKVGDYSYGMYIYAFPIQGFVIWAFGTMSPMMNILLAFPLTLLPSILSWHWIEKPALDSLGSLHEKADVWRTRLKL